MDSVVDFLKSFKVDGHTLYLVLGSGSLLLALQYIIEYRKAIHSVGHLPGFRHLFSPNGIVATAIPTFIPGIAIGRNQVHNSCYDDFKHFGANIMATVSLIPRPHVEVLTCDPVTVKEITSSRFKYPKPIHQYDIVMQFGRNIVAAEGEEWKKHRKIANPAFSEPNNKFVWEEAIRITSDMITNVWKNDATVTYDHVNEMTLQIALLIIGSAGFGRRISFSDDLKIPPGHAMSFKDALHVVSTNMIVPLVVPGWAMGLTAGLRRARTAFKELRLYMQEMIDARRSSGKNVENKDLFNNLLDANLDEDVGEAKLNDSELIGDIFIFLLAGHETTAHTLCFTLALLALYPEQQELLYQNIKQALPDGRIPTYEDVSALSYVLAVFHETLRFFPPVPPIPKYSPSDTSIVSTNLAGEKITVSIPKGANVTIHVPGLHRNPLYWKDPEEFRPSRFMDDWPRDAFLPFSGGARACIGRRFSETEAVAILTIIMSQYSVDIKDEPKFAGETFEQRKKRVLSATSGITTTPIRVPIVFKRRA